MQAYALMSVSNKDGIIELAQAFIQQDIQILSTGGTYQLLKAAGLDVQAVESVTQVAEMLDGRVKTLHPKIHGGILADRRLASHCEQMQANDLPAIDYVVVNLYPFKEVIQQADATDAAAIENIDIGGPTLLRAAAKNHANVTVVTDPRDYQTLRDQLAAGAVQEDFRRYLATKAFSLTAHYDAMISQYFQQTSGMEGADFPTYDWDFLSLTYDQGQSLRYGENSQQAAKVYYEVQPPQNSLAQAQQLNGKALSYNNLRDADAALEIIGEFKEAAAVAVKHMNPCGVGLGSDIEAAFEACYQADSVSIFGGIIALNRPVTVDLARRLAGIFLEIIMAPAFEAEALEILQKKKNLRLLVVDMAAESQVRDQYVSIHGGLLQQSADRSDELADLTPQTLPAGWKVLTDRQPELAAIAVMNFAMKVVKHVKSNAIVVATDQQTLGIGAGQMNRVGAAKLALDQAQASGQLDAGAVLASDAFFPMDDTVRLAHTYGIQLIIQPGGSIRDQDSIDACNELGICMVATGVRHFKH